MSKRKSPQAEEAVETALLPRAKPLRLSDYLTVKRADTHSDLKIKEAIHAALNRICDLTASFIAEKEAEGFSLSEILGLYEIVGPVTPTVTELPDGRLKVNWDVQIVEKGAEEEPA